MVVRSFHHFGNLRAEFLNAPAPNRRSADIRDQILIRGLADRCSIGQLPRSWISGEGLAYAMQGPQPGGQSECLHAPVRAMVIARIRECLIGGAADAFFAKLWAALAAPRL